MSEQKKTEVDGCLGCVVAFSLGATGLFYLLDRYGFSVPRWVYVTEAVMFAVVAGLLLLVRLLSLAEQKPPAGKAEAEKDPNPPAAEEK
jgi:hypothetical protein